MKTVFTDISQVSHLWANQLQESARNSGNYYFNGDSIYSYGSHFMIAKHHTNKQGKSVVLFTTRSYSNTTAKQIGVTRAACSHKDLIFCKNPDGISHTENFNNWQSLMESSAKSLANARKPEKYLNEISAFYAQAEVYAQYFDLNVPEGLKSANSISSKEDYKEFEEKRQALIIKTEKKHVAKLKKDHKALLTKWRGFESNRLSIYDGKDYLRYNVGKNRIQTSQNVEIPIQIAKEFYSYILNTVSNGGCIQCDKKLMEFDVNAIDKKFVRVGCHNVPMKEIKGIAKQLGW